MRFLTVVFACALFIPVADAASSSRTSKRWVFSARSVVRRAISAPSTSSARSSRSASFSIPGPAAYKPYAPTVAKDGKVKALFFTSKTCGPCESTDFTVTAWYPSMHLVPAYRVDIDAERALATSYGVTGPQTFVRVDGAGKKVGFLANPTVAALMDFLAR